MPQFFDEGNLSPEQKSRWDWAMQEYERVIEGNLRRYIDTMSPDKQNDLLLSFLENMPNAPRNLYDNLRRQQDLFGGRAGNSKSALFARLLDGRPALPEPPPTSYSYPWYAIIEESGPFEVAMGGVVTLAGQMRGTSGAQGTHALGINQCAWAIVACNQPATQLIALQNRLVPVDSEIQQPSEMVPDNSLPRYTWTPELLSDLLLVYTSDPEFRVRHGNWPEYRLYLGQRSAPSQRKYAATSIEHIMNRDPRNLSFCGDVFSVEHLWLNPVFGKVIEPAQHPSDLLQREIESLQSDIDRGFTIFQQLNESLIRQSQQNLEADIRAFESDPSAQDLVEVFTDRWLLERIEANQ